MSCYFQACSEPGRTKEHIPPKSFFPKDQRNQLLTVKSCDRHNIAKSSDDVYVLAHICMNVSPSNRSREVFKQSAVPQLGHNAETLRKRLVKGAVVLPSGAFYKVQIDRFHNFFTALSCGIVYKACGARLPAEYRIGHLYHDFKNEKETPEKKALKSAVIAFHSGEPIAVLDFGRVNAMNATTHDENQNIMWIILLGPLVIFWVLGATIIGAARWIQRGFQRSKT